VTDDEWYKRAAADIATLTGPSSRPASIVILDEAGTVAQSLDRPTALHLAAHLVRLAARLDPPLDLLREGHPT
jgi:hypothetical protein